MAPDDAKPLSAATPGDAVGAKPAQLDVHLRHDRADGEPGLVVEPPPLEMVSLKLFHHLMKV